MLVYPSFCYFKIIKDYNMSMILWLLYSYYYIHVTMTAQIALLRVQIMARPLIKSWSIYTLKSLCSWQWFWNGLITVLVKNHLNPPPAGHWYLSARYWTGCNFWTKGDINLKSKVFEILKNATTKNKIFNWSHDLICIILHLIKNQLFLFTEIL